MIGLIGAMDEEVKILKSRMKNVTEQVISGMAFWQGTLEGRECVAAVSGIGKVHSAICAQTMILTYRPEAVINTGVAGGIGEGIKIGDIVVARDVVQHDMDTTYFGDPKGLIPGIDMVFIPCDKMLNEKVVEAAGAVEGLPCHLGTIATGDEFIGGKERLNRLLSDFGAVACEMEGGSIGQVCYLNRVPFTVVRSISDNANDDAHIDYPKFLAVAVEKSASLICKLMPLL